MSSAAKRAAIEALEQRGGGAAASSTGACATGASAASATGAARSRSSTATPAASCRCRTTSCRSCCPPTSTFDKPGNPLDHHPTWKHVACPRCGSAGAPRDRHDGHVRRQLLVFRPLLRARMRPRPLGPAGGRPLAAGRPVYRRHRARDPAPALRPLLHPRAAEDRPDRHRRAVRRPVHPGHGHPRELPGRPTAAGSTRTMSRSCRTAPPAHRRPASRSTVGRDETMSKCKRNTVDPGGDHRPLRRRYRALVRALRQPARARHRMDRGRASPAPSASPSASTAWRRASRGEPRRRVRAPAGSAARSPAPPIAPSRR